MIKTLKKPFKSKEMIKNNMRQYSIDSLIEKYKTKAENTRQNINRMEYYQEKEYEQIVEYLEELKKYRQEDIHKMKNVNK